MKTFLFCLLACSNFMIAAQEIPDSVVMIINGAPVSVDEFLFMAGKNSAIDLTEEQALKEYVELYKNFKLKVADAKELNLDQTQSFKDEYTGYKAQLMNGSPADKQPLNSLNPGAIEATAPEYKLLLQEYYDGTLLFEVSNLKVWSRPLSEQKRLEEEWMNELNSKYPAVINWPLLRKIVIR